MLRFDGVVFDMDDTLVRSPLEFAAIRAELGIPPQEGIIEAIAGLPPRQRRQAEQTVLSYELSAAGRAELIDGAAEALQAITAAGLKTALLTRNCGQAMDIVLGRFAVLRFDLTWSREDGPIKPEPDGILRACRTLGIRPERTACVGDFRYDMLAAKAAGAVAVLYSSRGRPELADDADYVIDHLRELPGLLGI